MKSNQQDHSENYENQECFKEQMFQGQPEQVNEASEMPLVEHLGVDMPYEVMPPDEVVYMDGAYLEPVCADIFNEEVSQQADYQASEQAEGMIMPFSFPSVTNIYAPSSDGQRFYQGDTVRLGANVSGATWARIRVHDPSGNEVFEWVQGVGNFIENYWNIPSNAIGTHTVVYSAFNAAGNQHNQTRVINVAARVTAPVPVPAAPAIEVRAQDATHVTIGWNQVQWAVDYEIFIDSVSFTIITLRSVRLEIPPAGVTRTVFVRARNSARTPSGNSNSLQIRSSQPGGGSNFLHVSPQQMTNVAAAGGRLEISVTSNLHWTVRTDIPWIMFDPNGGSGNGKFILTCPPNTGSFRSGNVWVTVGDLADRVYIPISQQSGQPTSVNITFDANGGWPNADRPMSPGSLLGSFPSVGKADHVLIGWFTDPNGGSQIFPHTPVPNHDERYFARWHPVTLTAPGQYSVHPLGNITINWAPVPGATFILTVRDLDTYEFIINPQTVTGTSFTIPQSLLTAGNEYRVSLQAVLNGNVGWSERRFSIQAPVPVRRVTFNPNGGTVSPSTRAVTSGNPIGTLPMPSRANNTFIGWFTAQTGGSLVSANTIVNSDMTLFARWNVTITFNPSGGTVTPPSRTVLSGSPIGSLTSPLPVPSRANNTFIGWFTAQTGGSLVSANTIVNSDMTLFARWNVTITFNPNGGTVSPPSRSVQSGNPIALLPTPRREGNTFAGWFTAQTGGSQVSVNTAFNVHTTIFARWTVTINFDPRGGTLTSASQISSVSGSPITQTITHPTKPGHNFDGWLVGLPTVMRLAQTLDGQKVEPLSGAVPASGSVLQVGTVVQDVTGMIADRNLVLSALWRPTALQTTNPPAQRRLITATANSIEVNATPAPSGWTTQYRIRVAPSGDWSAWQNSNTFNGVTANIHHHVQARFTADNTNTHAHSAESVVSGSLWTETLTIRPLPQLTGNLRTDIVVVARSQVGAREEGDTNRNPFSREVRGGDGHPWCGDFTAWVLWRVGLRPYVSSIAVRHPNEAPIGEGWYFSRAANWHIVPNHDRWQRVTTPEPGDIVVWQNHVAIVTSVNEYGDGSMTFVGGNQSNRVDERTANVINPVWPTPQNPQAFLGYVRLNRISNPTLLPTAPTLNAINSVPAIGGQLIGSTNFARYTVHLNLWCETCQQLLLNQTNVGGSGVVINAPVAGLPDLTPHQGHTMIARLFNRSSNGETPGNEISFTVQ